MSETAVIAPAEQPVVTAPILKAILAQKVGMTRIFDANGKAITVTVLQAGPCAVTQGITPQKHGYSAIQVAFGEVRTKSLNKPYAGIFKKANVAPARWLREFRTDKAASFHVGHSIKVDAFAAGGYVDVF